MPSAIFASDDFLTAQQCQAIISEAEQTGFGPAPITTGRGFLMVPEVRNNTRVMVDDVALAERLWARLEQMIALEPVEGWRAVGLNERFRYYRYAAGQAFRWHRDGSFVRSDTERSLFTFMVYLNDGFEGGATEFEHLSVVPRAGKAVVFEHRLRHQGAEVSRGTKYVLRSDVMFERAV